MKLSLKEFNKLDKTGKARFIAELIGELDLDSRLNAHMKLFRKLQQYEEVHKISSADMFDSADCEKRELDPELDEWATLYRCYKGIA